MVKGVAAQFVFLLLFGGTVFYYIQQARHGKKIWLRKLAGLDAVEEAMGRAAELGKPVLYSPGLDTVMFPQMLAGLAFLPYVAGLAARYSVRLICAQRDQVVYSIAEETIRQVYMQHGKPDAFNPADIRVFPDRYAYVTGMIGVIENEKVAANIMVGLFRAEALLLVETANRIGCMQVAAAQDSIPAFVIACDYVMIGEELYAASAYVSDDEVPRAVIVAQDIGKFVIAALIVIGALMTTMGDKSFAALLKM